MNYRKILKYIFIVIMVITTIFTIIYYAAITRADDTTLLEQDSGIEGTNLDRVLNYIEDFFKKESEVFINNTTGVTQTENVDSDLTEEGQLNRKLLNECLAQAENEWEDLQKHYNEVLNECVIIDLGLNGGKLFNISECEERVSPFKVENQDRIQSIKEKCFESYSERQ